MRRNCEQDADVKKLRNYRCDGLDRQIDALVYDLYALTPAEIKIVEGSFGEKPNRQ